MTNRPRASRHHVLRAIAKLNDKGFHEIITLVYQQSLTVDGVPDKDGWTRVRQVTESFLHLSNRMSP